MLVCPHLRTNQLRSEPELAYQIGVLEDKQMWGCFWTEMPVGERPELATVEQVFSAVNQNLDIWGTDKNDP
jgi:hypothetical protein